MDEKMKKILSEVKEKIKGVKDLNVLNEIKATYLGKKGVITELASQMKDLDVDARKEFGKALNDIKTGASELFDNLKNKLETEALNKKLENEKIDISLPATKIECGAPSILEKLIEEIE